MTRDAFVWFVNLATEGGIWEMAQEDVSESTDEAEITTEMIEAGVRELIFFNRDFESEESCVERVYSATFHMRKTRFTANYANWSASRGR